MSVIELRKIPTTKDNYVGVEIEFLLKPAIQKTLVSELIKAGLEYNVHVGRDGSVTDTEFQPVYRTVRRDGWTDTVIANESKRMTGMEIRVLATEKEIPDVIKKTCKIIKTLGGKVNATCGLHVHLDMRNRDFDKVFNNFYFSQNLLFSTQPLMRKNGTYSKMLKSKNRTGDRYYGVNRLAYQEHKTLELRMHEGSIDEKEILVWIGSLIRIANLEKKLGRQLKTFKTLEVPKKVEQYFEERIKKYGETKKA